MRRLLITAILVSFALGAASVAHAAPKPTPPTAVPTTPSIDGAVYTTVDLNDPNYKSECHNGNPAVNCNQYTAKQFVFLNGGPSKNKLTPDGVYFFAVLAPGTQKNPADGTLSADGAPGNLSDDYDCYLNREVIIKGGEVTGVLKSTDPSCFHNTSVLPVGTGHKLSGPLGPFVQLWPYIDTPNPGGVYIMSVCYVASPATTPTAPVALADPTKVDPSTCKYDAFKVLIDTTPPVCRLFSTNAGPPKSITVLVQDQESGIESLVYSGFNLASSTQTPDPLIVGSVDPVYVIATKDVQTVGATLTLTATDVAGNTTTCDPMFGAVHHARAATVHAGHRVVLRGLGGDQSRLRIQSSVTPLRAVKIVVNGHRFAVVSLRRNRSVLLNLVSALRPHKLNTVAISPVGTTGTVRVRISG